MESTLPRRLIAVTATVAVALAAALAVPASAGASTVSAKGAKATKPRDSAIAKAALLTLADFPAGWTQSKHKDAKPSGLASCKATEGVVAKNKKYRAESPDFQQGDTSIAQNTVLVFPKASQATAYLKPYQLAAAGKCLQQGTQKALRKISGVTVQVQQLDLSSALQGGNIDDAVGYELLATIPQQGTPLQLVLVAIAVRVGRGVAGFTTQNSAAPLTETDSLINASLGRLKAALA
jgi:hypothetical protein